MQYVNKPQLLERILALLASAMSAPASLDQEELRRQLSSAIDASLSASTDAESREVTILLSDLRGFTSLAESYSSIAIVEALNRYLACMSEIIVRHGGSIDKFMGDSIMALFGAPRTQQNHINAALNCAIEMQQAMAQINQQNQVHGMASWYMGIGINTGEVVACNLGSALHSEYTVIGDEVNLASRVEAHTLRGQILLSENTYQHAKDYIEIGDINQVQVKGKQLPVTMYELLSSSRPTLRHAPRRELRNSHRVEVNLPLQFNIIDGKSVRPEVHSGNIHNLSYGGMFLSTQTPLTALSDIRVNLSLSLMGYEQTQLYAKVLRIIPRDNGLECPVEFTAIDVKAQQVIKDLVDRMVAQK